MTLTKMKAVIKPHQNVGLRLTEVPIPTIGNQDVLIKVKAASICGSDIPIYNWDDSWVQSTIKPGQIIGHEFVGEVVEVGSNVPNVQVGDRVTAEGHLYCRECFHCKNGEAHICPNQKLVGFDYPGAFAEYIAVPYQNIVGLGEIPFIFGAIADPLGNALHATMIKTLTNATVLITGCGPIGLMTIVLAKLSGAEKIFATDVSNYRLELAMALGADLVLNPENDDIEYLIGKETILSAGVDIWLEMSGMPAAINQGFRLLRPGGDAILLGLPKTEVEFDFANDLIAKGITVHGIIGRRIYQTWNHVTRILRNRHFTAYLRKIITHQLLFDDFENAFALVQSGNCGKVLLFPDSQSLASCLPVTREVFYS